MENRAMTDFGLLSRFRRMSVPEQATTLIAVPIAIFICGLVWAHWLSNVVPRTPKSVPAEAVFLWAPAVGFPGGLPRRGNWLACSENLEKIRCSLWTIDGVNEYEGEFVGYPEPTPVPPDQLKIDTAKTDNSVQVWTGATEVPAVYLENGRILIPRDLFADFKKQLDKAKADRQ
jgi:hypothetical protein